MKKTVSKYILLLTIMVVAGTSLGTAVIARRSWKLRFVPRQEWGFESLTLDCPNRVTIVEKVGFLEFRKRTNR